MEELIRYDGNQVVASAETLEQIKSLIEEFNSLKDAQDNIKAQIKQVMKEHGVKSWDNDYFLATYVAPKITKRLDVTSLKAFYPEVYEDCLEESVTSDSIRLTIKKG